jgi:hypothetical protein
MSWISIIVGDNRSDLGLPASTLAEAVLGHVAIVLENPAERSMRARRGSHGHQHEVVASLQKVELRGDGRRGNQKTIVTTRVSV